MSIDDSTRHQLVVLARRPRSRDTKFSAERPTEWRPHEVRNSTVDLPFTNSAAWELIASRLEDGHDVKVVTLDNPRGKPGYVMKIRTRTGGSPALREAATACRSDIRELPLLDSRVARQSHDPPFDDHAYR